MYYIGTAGWNVPKSLAEEFPGTGHWLERYAHRLNAVEINSSFYRLHKPETYARWAALTPPEFRFSVKLPRQITHFSGLRDLETLRRFYESTLGLGEKVGAWLVQLPPSLAFVEGEAAHFFEAIRTIYEGDVVCEPRHLSWFTPAAERLLSSLRIGRAAAHPAPHPQGEKPAAWQELIYYRFHGEPQKYVSSYEPKFLAQLAGVVRSFPPTARVWIVFNNTAQGAAWKNALDLWHLIRS